MTLYSQLIFYCKYFIIIMIYDTSNMNLSIKINKDKYINLMI